MKILLAVVTCHAREDWATAVRETWATILPPNVDVRFFLGRGALREPLNDEVFLDCDDSYEGLPDKVQSIIRWALERDYEFMLKCDDDVVLKIDSLLASGFDQYDFTGRANGNGFHIPFGFNYWLSRKAMLLVKDEPLPPNNNDEAWVTRTLERNGIQLHNDDRYCLDYGYGLGPEMPHRALRRPPVPDRIPHFFSWCMHNKKVSRERLILEFKRIYRDCVKCISQLPSDRPARGTSTDLPRT